MGKGKRVCNFGDDLTCCDGNRTRPPTGGAAIVNKSNGAIYNAFPRPRQAVAFCFSASDTMR